MIALSRALLLITLFSMHPVATANNWWESPPLDDSEYIYGLGEGSSLMLAKQQALADISGKLSTQVSASLARVTRETGQSYTDDIVREIRSRVSPANLSQFQIIGNHRDGARNYVLIQLDRSKLANIWKQKLFSIRSKVQTILDSSIHNFTQWKEAYSNLPQAKKATELDLQLMTLVDAKPADDVYHLLSQKLKNRPLKISIEGDNELLNSAIAESIAASDLLTQCKVKCDAEVSYEINHQNDFLFKQYIYKTSGTFYLKDNDILMETDNISVSSSSSTSYEDARSKSLVNLANKSEAKNLFSLFNKPLQ